MNQIDEILMHSYHKDKLIVVIEKSWVSAHKQTMRTMKKKPWVISDISNYVIHSSSKLDIHFDFQQIYTFTIVLFIKEPTPFN